MGCVHSAGSFLRLRGVTDTPVKRRSNVHNAPPARRPEPQSGPCINGKPHLWESCQLLACTVLKATMGQAHMRVHVQALCVRTLLKRPMRSCNFISAERSAVGRGPALPLTAHHGAAAAPQPACPRSQARGLPLGKGRGTPCVTACARQMHMHRRCGPRREAPGQCTHHHWKESCISPEIPMRREARERSTPTENPGCKVGKPLALAVGWGGHPQNPARAPPPPPTAA